MMQEEHEWIGRYRRFLKSYIGKLFSLITVQAFIKKRCLYFPKAGPRFLLMGDCFHPLVGQMVSTICMPWELGSSSSQRVMVKSFYGFLMDPTRDRTNIQFEKAG